ncbi:MAG: TonB-dependent receptor [Tannerella sp.]|jgi:iron complex outermembrane receptor protein|nr:TonB-dependent receptor [Tannerella sp.]
MHNRIYPVVFMFVSVLSANAQEKDSIKTIELDSVTVTAASYRTRVNRSSTLPVEVAGKEFLHSHFTGNLMQTLEYLPGVRSMDVGSGFSKPVIRGMGFNRVSMVENGIKQEGQQWGSDHGFEIDAFNIERVAVRKGPSSLLYGSDAMGGVIEITQTPAPENNGLHSEVSLLTKSATNALEGSVMLGFKHDALYAKLRYSEKHFADYRIPADTIVYLTQQIPVYNHRLKNTAGLERDVNFYAEFRQGRYSSGYAFSDTYQKTGFFPGAHGIPDVSRVRDDGDSRNIELPFSLVNHLKASSRQQYFWDNVAGTVDIGFQNNHREEWSQFHTHYGSQQPPTVAPDKELQFALNTFSASAKLRSLACGDFVNTLGSDFQYQQNRIDGYSFLLPEYDRLTAGLFALSERQLSTQLSVSGGVRYDYGKINISAYSDPYLNQYLHEMGYNDELTEQYRWRSYPVDRSFGNFSGSLGIVWNPAAHHSLKANIGSSFRLPGANELAANGVHHGTFRHEQGETALSSERGWQLDGSYIFDNQDISLSAASFFSSYDNYIYLKPTGEWSVLPHAGQIYRYTGAEAVFAGAEVSLDARLLKVLKYSIAGEYVYTYNRTERTPLSFSPPASLRNTLSLNIKNFQVYTEMYNIAAQNRVAKNESRTPGAELFNLGGSISVPFAGAAVELSLSLRNLFDTKYFNHLSFYRKVEIPEPGRNLTVKITIYNSKL